MKNPCDDDCLVQPMCTEVCDEKTNYGKLLEQATLEHKSRFFTKEGKYNPLYKKTYLHWKALANNNRLQIVVINTRAREINKI